MKQRTTIAVAMLTCLTIFSCGSNSEKKKVTDKMVGKISADKTVDPAAAVEGGQPGAVTIMGQALITEMGPLDPNNPKKITIHTQTGFGTNMVQATMKAGDVIPTPDVTADNEDLLQMMDEDKTFINIGCDISARTDLKDLQEKKVTPESMSEIAMLRANTVLICGTGPIKAGVTFILAKNVVLNNLQHNMVGGQESFITITTRELKLTGTTLITATGKNGTPVLPLGPAVTMTAQKLSGSGTIQIMTSGASIEDLKVTAADKTSVTAPVIEEAKK